MEFLLDPPSGVGPLRLGMTPDEARAALETIGPLQPTAQGELAVHLDSGLGFSVGFGAATGRVDAIEVWRPHERDVVRYHDVDVFGLPAVAVVERLRSHAAVAANEDDDGFTARELYLALWRPFAADDDPAETQGHFFQSVLVAAPGYDDTPAEAAARLAAGSAVRAEVRRFVELGPLPSEDDDEAALDQFEQALLAIEGPVNDAEAALLSGSFGTDNCFGLAWTLLHLVETAPTAVPSTEPAVDANPWLRRLWLRRRRASSSSA